MASASDPSRPDRPALEEPPEGPEARSLVANSTFALAARVYGVVASAVVAFVTVRLLSVDEYGRYALAMAVVLLLGSLAELGMSALVTRQVAAQPRDTPRLLGVALAAEAATGVVASALSVPVGLALGYSGQVLVLLAIGCGVILTQGMLAVLNAAFQARRVFSLFAMTTVAQTTVLLGGSVVVLLAGAGPVGLVAVAVGAYGVAALAALGLLRRAMGMVPALADARAGIVPFLRAAAPIAATAGASVVYGRVDVLLLGHLGSERQVAIYNLPLTLVETSLLIPGAVAGAFYPLFTRQLEDDREDARRSFDLLYRLFLFGAGGLALFAGVAGPQVIEVVFGGAYRASGGALSWLSATIAFNFLIYLFWYGLLAAHRERGRLPAILAGLALNVVLNIVLIPAHGAEGAAAALAATDLVMVVWLGVVVQRRVIAVALVARALAPLLAVAVALAFLLIPLDLPGVVSGAVCALIYLGGLQATGYVTPAEWAPFLAPLRNLLQSRTKR